jgi:hypothetical protein
VRLGASVIGGLLAFVGVAILSAAMPAGVGGIVAVLGIPLVILAFVRGLRISLMADRQMIVVRNFFRTHSVPWTEIEGIGIGFHGMGGAPLDAIAITRRGRRAAVTSQATVSSSRERRRVLGALKAVRPDLSIRFYDEA